MLKKLLVLAAVLQPPHQGLYRYCYVEDEQTEPNCTDDVLLSLALDNPMKQWLIEPYACPARGR